MTQIVEIRADYLQELREDRDAVLEQAAQAVEQLDREGRDWVPDSLWANILRDAAARVRALIEARPRWRHRKRGTTYTQIGIARLQVSGSVLPAEGDLLVIYRADHDGTLWARDSREFSDGRFEAISDETRA